MKKILLPLIILSLLPLSLCAEIFAKTGTAALQFLKIGVDARALGMGEAYIAVSDDISSVYWNPAGLAKLYEKNLQSQAMLSHTQWPADIMQEYFAFSKETNYGMLALSGTVLHMAEMDVTDEYFWGPTGETFNASDLAVGLTYANAFTDKFSFGFTGKFIQENLAEDQVNTFSLDLGSLYNTGYKNITIGMALRNFGPDIKYDVDDDNDGSVDEDPFDLFDNDGDGVIDEDGEGTEYKIPMNFSLGIAMDFMRDDTSYLIGSVQLDNCVDRKETWNLGTEYNWNNFFLRGGYQIAYDAAGLSCGFGVKLPVRAGIFNIDYAYTDMGDLTEDFVNGAHRLSIKFGF